MTKNIDTTYHSQLRIKTESVIKVSQEFKNLFVSKELLESKLETQSQ